MARTDRAAVQALFDRKEEADDMGEEVGEMDFVVTNDEKSRQIRCSSAPLALR